MEIWDFCLEISLKNHWNFSRLVCGNPVALAALSHYLNQCCPKFCDTVWHYWNHNDQIWNFHAMRINYFVKAYGHIVYEMYHCEYQLVEQSHDGVVIWKWSWSSVIWIDDSLPTWHQDIFCKHWHPVTPYGFIELGQHWFRKRLVACLAPNYYLKQCWRLFSWIFQNKLQWNWNELSFFTPGKFEWNFG